MPRRPDVPCSSCGSLLWSGTTSLPADQRCCRDCRRARRRPAQAAPKRRVGRSVHRICQVCCARFRSTYPAQETCGRACGLIWKRRPGNPSTEPPAKVEPARREPTFVAVWFNDCVHCGQTFCSRRRSTKFCDIQCGRRHYNARRPKPPRPAWACQSCGSSADQDKPRSPYCTSCARVARTVRKGNHRARARKFGVPYEPVRAADIFHRDHWTCGLCDDPIDKTVAWPNQMCASLDHIIPMALGGGHVAANVQAAHWLCNVLKGCDQQTSFKVAA